MFILQKNTRQNKIKKCLVKTKKDHIQRSHNVII